MTTEHIDAGAGAVGLGATLAQLREAKGWSLADVSERLKFSPRQVESLEAERFDELPAGPVLRGFVRNYARILDTDPEALLNQLDALSPSKPLRVEPMPSLAAPVPKLRPARGGGSRSTGLFVGLVFVVLAVLAAAGWFAMGGHSFGEAPTVAQKPDSTSLAANAPAAPAGAATAAGAPGQAAPHGQDGAATRADTSGSGAAGPAAGDAPAAGGATATPPSAVAGSSAAAPASPPAPGAGVIPTAVQPSPPAVATSPADRQDAGLIRLKFKDASWVEVRQRDGRVLLSQLNPGDTEKTLAGQPPFKMVIGNAPAVQLEYKGAPVDLKPMTSRDNVARVTLN